MTTGADAVTAVSRGGPGVVARALMALVAAYRWIPKSATPRCRFYPSCSAYALGALERHGASKGTMLALRRIARCHPFHPGGVDPVPGDATQRAPAAGEVAGPPRSVPTASSGAGATPAAGVGAREGGSA